MGKFLQTRVVKRVILKIRFSGLFFQSSKVTVSGGRIRPKIPNSKSQELKSTVVNLEISPPLYYYPMECFDFDFDFYNTSDNFIRTIREKRTVFYPNATEIRRNPYYYTIYCVALNTCFATLLPLAALIYLNCMTLRALRRLFSQQTNSTQSNSRQLDTIEEENSRCSGPIIHSLKSSGLEKKPADVNRILSSRTTPPRTNNYSSERFVRGTRFICGFDNQSSSFGGLDGNVMDVRYVHMNRITEFRNSNPTSIAIFQKGFLISGTIVKLIKCKWFMQIHFCIPMKTLHAKKKIV